MKIIVVKDDGTTRTINDVEYYKAWTREDLGDALEYRGVYPSMANIDALVNSKLLDGLEEASEGWDYIDDAIYTCADDKAFTGKTASKPNGEPTFQNIQRPGQKLVPYTLSGDYFQTYHLLADEETDIFRADLSSLLEETLHELLDAGASDTEIRFLTGMVRHSEENDEAYPENGRIEIDLGYFLPSGIARIRS